MKALSDAMFRNLQKANLGRLIVLLSIFTSFFVISCETPSNAEKPENIISESNPIDGLSEQNALKEAPPAISKEVIERPARPEGKVYSAPIGKKEIATFPHLTGFIDQILLGNLEIQVVLAGIPSSPPEVDWFPAVLAVFQQEEGRWKKVEKHFRASLKKLDPQKRPYYPIAVDMGVTQKRSWGFVKFIFASKEGASKKEVISWLLPKNRPALSMVAENSDRQLEKKSKRAWQLRLQTNKKNSIKVVSEVSAEKNRYRLFYAGRSVLAMLGYGAFLEKIVDQSYQINFPSIDTFGLEGFELLFGQLEADALAFRNLAMKKCREIYRKTPESGFQKTYEERFFELQQCIEKIPRQTTVVEGESGSIESFWFLENSKGEKLTRLLVEADQKSFLDIDKQQKLYISRQKTREQLAQRQTLAKINPVKITINHSQNLFGSDRPFVFKLFNAQNGTHDLRLAEDQKENLIKQLSPSCYLLKKLPMSMFLPPGRYVFEISSWQAKPFCQISIDLKEGQTDTSVDCNATSQKLTANQTKNMVQWQGFEGQAEKQYFPFVSSMENLLNHSAKDRSKDSIQYLSVADKVMGIELRMFPADEKLLDMWVRYDRYPKYNRMIRFAKFAKERASQTVLELSCMSHLPIYDFEKFLKVLSPDAVRAVGCGVEAYQKELFKVLNDYQKFSDKPLFLTPASFERSSDQLNELPVVLFHDSIGVFRERGLKIGDFIYSRGLHFNISQFNVTLNKSRQRKIVKFRLEFSGSSLQEDLKLKIFSERKQLSQVSVSSEIKQTTEGLNVYDGFIVIPVESKWMRFELVGKVQGLQKVLAGSNYLRLSEQSH